MKLNWRAFEGSARIVKTQITEISSRFTSRRAFMQRKHITRSEEINQFLSPIFAAFISMWWNFEKP